MITEIRPFQATLGRSFTGRVTIDARRLHHTEYERLARWIAESVLTRMEIPAARTPDVTTLNVRYW